jgi:hypothetical protein
LATPIQEIAWRRRNVINAEEKEKIQIGDALNIPPVRGYQHFNTANISHDQLLFELFDVPLPPPPLACNKRPIENDIGEQLPKRACNAERRNEPLPSKNPISKRPLSQDFDDPSRKRPQPGREVL